VVVNDCGTVMFGSGAEAQQVGGQCIGLGEALTEEIVYDPATGIPLNFNWIDYQIPTMADMPEIDPLLLEVWRGGGEYGACGIGEGTVTCTPRASFNAMYQAIGVRLDDRRRRRRSWPLWEGVAAGTAALRLHPGCCWRRPPSCWRAVGRGRRGDRRHRPAGTLKDGIHPDHPGL
jgi:hypothetical protein